VAVAEDRDLAASAVTTELIGARVRLDRGRITLL
jgi:hypothetical protein